MPALAADAPDRPVSPPASADRADGAPPPVEPAAELRLDLVGMSCASCARRIATALSAVDGATAADVNFATRRATVAYDPRRASPARFVAAVSAAGYGATPVSDATTRGPDAATRAAALAAEESRDDARRRREASLAAALTLPVLVLAMSHGAIPGAHGPLGLATQAALSAFVVFRSGREILRLGRDALRRGRADMNATIGLGAVAAWGYSAAVLAASALGGAGSAAHPAVYFEAAAAIVAFALVGRRVEERARRRLSESVRALAALAPPTAHRLLPDGTAVDAPVAEIAAGDVVLVRPGERVPTDGDVLRGTSEVDESTLTGESEPRAKAPGSAVLGGTLNGRGSLTIVAARAGADTALARIVESVERAQASRPPLSRLSDAAAAAFVPLVLGVAALTFVGWLVADPSASGLATAVERCVAVLVAACPCAFGLAAPAAVASAAGRGAELGILVKGGAALEAASRVDAAFLDKTGTLTEGRPALTDVVAADGFDPTRVLAAAAALAARSGHPVARAISAGAAARGVAYPPSASGVETAGAGLVGTVDGAEVRVGTSAWLAGAGASTAALDAAAERLAAAGRTPAFVSLDGVAAGVLGVADEVRPDARRAIEELRRMGVAVAMATGDRRGVAEAVAARLGLSVVHAELSPEDKLRLVERARVAGRTVAMIGDGVNDAPALAAAHLGVAAGGAADAATAVADLALLRGGVGALPRALRLARAAMRVARQNLVLAFAYNALAVPVAAGALYPATGLLLSPALASAAMALSSTSVLLNALRLRRFDRGTEPSHD
jgi:Cu+-exporting ATPase